MTKINAEIITDYIGVAKEYISLIETNLGTNNFDESITAITEGISSQLEGLKMLIENEVNKKED